MGDDRREAARKIPCGETRRLEVLPGRLAGVALVVKQLKVVEAIGATLCLRHDMVDMSLARHDPPARSTDTPVPRNDLLPEPTPRGRAVAPGGGGRAVLRRANLRPRSKGRDSARHLTTRP
jgi:hypothetical protein